MKAWLVAAGAAAIVAAYASSGLHDGVPALRHDWGIPSNPDAWRAFGLNAASGWDVRGIGAPQPYPTLFVLGPVLAALALALGSNAALGALLCGIAAAMLVAGIRIARSNGGTPWFGIALGSALLFCPWSYEQLVAGHLTMLLSLAACALLASELLQERPRRWVVVLSAYCAAFQIQYAMLAIVLSAAVRFDRRTIVLTCAGSGLSILPSLVGIVLAHSALLNIPYTLPWQFANSVPPAGGVALDGYSQGYTAGSSAIFQAGGFLLLATAFAGFLLGVMHERTRAAAIRCAILAAIALCYASGLRGWFAGLYEASLNVRQTLVFRELFDLVGLAGLLYVVLAASGARLKVLRLGAALSAIVMAAAWFIAPPSRWWVPSNAIPSPAVDTATPNVRFALLPVRQPLQFNGAGSGADPDEYARDDNVTPVNTYLPVYPSDAALSEYLRMGDPRDLEALSVTRIYARPYLTTNGKTLRVAVPIDRPPPSPSVSQTIDAQPELSLVGLPPDRDTPSPLHDLSLFYGGDPQTVARDLEAAHAPLTLTDARKGWVDASLAFSPFPEIANPIGGAFTLSSTVPLRVPGGRERALAYVRGTLSSQDGRVLSSSTGGWRWIALRHTPGLTCRGMCAVAAWEVHPYAVPAAAPQRTGGAISVPFRLVTPYVVTAQIPSSARAAGLRMLLFRSRYDSSWVAFGLAGVRHVAVNGIFNGFIAGRFEAGSSFVLVEMTAALQALAMLVSVAGVALVAAFRRREPQPVATSHVKTAGSVVQ